MPTTTRGALRYPLLADTPDVPRDIQNLANDVASLMTIYGQGTFASRPVSTVGTPGAQGRIYYGTDTGHFYYDFGTGWTDIGPTAAGIPDGSITGGPAGAGVKIAADTITHDNIAASGVRGGGNEIAPATITAADIAAALKPSGGAGGATESLRALGTAAGTAAAGTHASQHSRTGADPLVLGTFISSGLATARPSTGLVAGMIYTKTDVAGGTTEQYNGSIWVAMGSGVSTAGSVATSGVFASRPAAAGNSGNQYYATDQDVMYLSNGTSWLRVGSLPAGATCIWMNAAVPTGWVAYDGSNLPGSTGIYADLYAHLGATVVKPDTRSRVPLGYFPGGPADAATLKGTDAHGTRGIRHNQTVVDPGHKHDVNKTSNANEGAGTAVFVMKDGSTENTPVSGGGAAEVVAGTGISVGPGAGFPTDSPSWITVMYIAKL